MAIIGNGVNVNIYFQRQLGNDGEWAELPMIGGTAGEESKFRTIPSIDAIL